MPSDPLSYIPREDCNTAALGQPFGQARASGVSHSPGRRLPGWTLGRHVRGWWGGASAVPKTLSSFFPPTDLTPQKSLKELQEMDKDDESLIKYKKTLLGDGPVVAGMCMLGDRVGQVKGHRKGKHLSYSGAGTKERVPSTSKLKGVSCSLHVPDQVMDG